MQKVEWKEMFADSLVKGTEKEKLEQAEQMERRVLENVRRYAATHVILFENQQFDSSEFGRRTYATVGPNNTYKDVESAGKSWLYDLPSQRQYPIRYAEVPGAKK